MRTYYEITVAPSPSFDFGEFEWDYHIHRVTIEDGMHNYEWSNEIQRDPIYSGVAETKGKAKEEAERIIMHLTSNQPETYEYPGTTPKGSNGRRAPTKG